MSCKGLKKVNVQCSGPDLCTLPIHGIGAIQPYRPPPRPTQVLHLHTTSSLSPRRERRANLDPRMSRSMSRLAAVRDVVDPAHAILASLVVLAEWIFRRAIGSEKDPSRSSCRFWWECLDLRGAVHRAGFGRSVFEWGEVTRCVCRGIYRQCGCGVVVSSVWRAIGRRQAFEDRGSGAVQ